MKSLVVKRSIAIGGHKTSISLEHDFWSALKDIAHSRELTLSELVALVDAERKTGNLSSAVRLFVLEHFRSRAAERSALSSREATPQHHRVIV